MFWLVMDTKGRFTGSLHLAKYSSVFDCGHGGYINLSELLFDLFLETLADTWRKYITGGNMLLDKMNAFFLMQRNFNLLCFLSVDLEVRYRL